MLAHQRTVSSDTHFVAHHRGLYYLVDLMALSVRKETSQVTSENSPGESPRAERALPGR